MPSGSQQGVLVPVLSAPLLALSCTKVRWALKQKDLMEHRENRAGLWGRTTLRGWEEEAVYEPSLRAVTTDYLNLGGLKQQKCILCVEDGNLNQGVCRVGSSRRL